MSKMNRRHNNRMNLPVLRVTALAEQTQAPRRSARRLSVTLGRIYQMNRSRDVGCKVFVGGQHEAKADWDAIALAVDRRDSWSGPSGIFAAKPSTVGHYTRQLD
jgi:hypothetical protein